MVMISFRNLLICFTFVGYLFLTASPVLAETYSGVEIESATSFADTVVDYTAGDKVDAPYNEPSAALGAPDFTDNHNYDPALQVSPFPSVSLGDGGSLTLRFTNNALTTSGDSDIDLWVFEVGGQIESTQISISKDGSNWIDVDTIGGATSGIDIDAYLDIGVELWEKYYYVKITDPGDALSNPSAAGADIDAIAALSNVVTDDTNVPVAIIGPDQIVSEGDTVTLDAAAAYDPDGGSFTYLWEQTSGTVVPLSNATVVQPTFTAPTVAAEGESLLFRLTITDSSSLESSAETVVTVLGSSGNLPPVANAGPDQSGLVQGAAVQLSGSNSYDPEGQSIQSYSWTQVSGTSVDLSGSTSADPTFTAPFVGTSGDTLVFELTVTDANGLKDKDRCTVTLTGKNTAPVADAGKDQQKSPGAAVTLNGSGSSDADTDKGDQIGYHWKQVSGTRVDLSDNAVQQPTFTAPSLSADEALVFELTVTDLAGLQSSDTCIVNIVTGSNQAPVAEAGESTIIMVEEASYDLDGSGSSDPDGDTLTYLWEQKTGPPLTFSDFRVAQPTITAPAVTAESTAVVELTVTDPSGLKATDAITITIQDSESTDKDDGGCFISTVQ